MTELLPVLLLGVIAVAFAALTLVGPRRPNPTKLGAYESGNQPLADVPGTLLSVKFYSVFDTILRFGPQVPRWAVTKIKALLSGAKVGSEAPRRTGSSRSFLTVAITR